MNVYIFVSAAGNTYFTPTNIRLRYHKQSHLIYKRNYLLLVEKFKSI